jgi:C_GCAxxG_C_C family probable redox protein
MDQPTRAVDSFLDGYACSQAIISTYADLFDLDREQALKIAAGFAAGMRQAGTCGAVTGAYMVLGLKFSESDSEKPERRKPVYEAVNEFVSRFVEVNGSLNCRELLGCDISTAAGMETAKEGEMFKKVCPRFVKSSAEILEDMLKYAEEGKENSP